MLTIFCVLLLIIGELNSLSGQTEETVESTTHMERNITQSPGMPFDNYESHLLVGVVILSVVVVIVAVQFLLWIVYYMKTKKDDTNEVLVDAEETLTDTI